ncbi:hypothetical protein KCU99_g2958, partial [Aureobasidium melanogenum]
MVKTLPFGSSGLKVNSPGFGAMGLSFGLGTNLTFKQAEPVLLKAIEPGCTFWDTAVVYAAGINESLPRNLPSLNTISAIKSFPRVQNAALRFSKKKELRILQNISRDISMKLANKKRCSVTQIALAWVAAQGFIAIPGTTKPHRLEENWASSDVELSEEGKAELRRIIDSAKPHGNRYSEANQKLAGH